MRERNHVSVGIYLNGQYVINIVRPEHLEAHIEYNCTMRFGRALIVDGEIKNKGYLNDELLAVWQEKIKAMNIDASRASEMYH